MTAEKRAQRSHTDDASVVARHQCGIFLRSFLGRHFASKPVVALRNVGGFLRLKRDKCPKFQGYHIYSFKRSRCTNVSYYKGNRTRRLV